MNEKLQIWSFLNTDMMTLSKQVVQGDCFKKGQQWEQKIRKLQSSASCESFEPFDEIDLCKVTEITKRLFLRLIRKLIWLVATLLFPKYQLRCSETSHTYSLWNFRTPPNIYEGVIFTKKQEQIFDKMLNTPFLVTIIRYKHLTN